MSFLNMALTTGLLGAYPSLLPVSVINTMTESNSEEGVCLT